MRSAWACAIVGTISTIWICLVRLDLGVLAAIQCLIASNLSGMAALLVVLKGERTPWVRRHIFTRQVKTWCLFLVIYFGGMLTLAPPLRRDLDTFTWLALPVILSTGFTILAFGPIQDRIVARIQRRSRAS